jgi:hypothetical protein
LTDMPIATTYKGVAIFAGQSAKRVGLVKKEIDKINKISDLLQLFEIAGDVAWSPEARLLSAAKCIGGLERATERREARPDIAREDVEARTAGLASLTWAHALKYCSLFDAHDERAAMREQPLCDDGPAGQPC